jgi:cyanoexosortase B
MMLNARSLRFDRSKSDYLALLLLGLIYGPLMAHWVVGWVKKTISIEHEYFSHGLIGLPFAAYLIWSQRQAWDALPGGTGDHGGKDRWAGLGLLILGGLFYLMGLPDTVNLSLPMVLTGGCLWLKGMPGLKLMGFPLLLIALATPNELPYLIAPFTVPLQAFIAGSAGIILNLMGFPVRVEGIHLIMGNKLVEVAPYCAGLKMLFTSLYVALMLLHWTDNLRSKSIVRTFLLLAAAVSVVGNIIRNTILTFFHGTGNESAFIWLHDGWGGDLYSGCLLGCLVLLIGELEKRMKPVEA